MSDGKFKYGYNAPTKEERREIEDVRRRYRESEEQNGLERLRKLDAAVKNPPVVWGLTLGIIGVLIFGTGLTMVLEWSMLLCGVVVMFSGCVLMAAAYPVYNVVYASKKKKYSEEILKLSDELLGEGSEDEE